MNITDTQLKNLDYEALMQIVDGKEELGREIMQTMVDELSGEGQLLSQLVAKQDWVQLDYLTDRLCGSAAWCGMTKIKHFSHMLNAAVNQHNLSKISIQLDMLQHAIDDALQEAADLNFKPNTLISN